MFVSVCWKQAYVCTILRPELLMNEGEPKQLCSLQLLPILFKITDFLHLVSLLMLRLLASRRAARAIWLMKVILTGSRDEAQDIENENTEFENVENANADNENAENEIENETSRSS